MPRQRDPAEFHAMLETIKQVARAQMTQEGTAALSLRAIAREMDVTAPALYRYYASRDDLITALILDGFTHIAEAMAQADAGTPPADFRGRARAIYHAYRGWALAHWIDFQLIYGNPIPGYVAPSEVTVPAVIKGFRVFGTVLGEAWLAGALSEPAHGDLPPSSIDTFTAIMAREAMPGPPSLLYGLFSGWARVHGLVTLEMHGHLHQTVGDEAEFFAHEVERLLNDLGFP